MYDTRCEELARYFLDEGTEEAIRELAQAIQNAVEDEIQSQERRAEGSAAK